MRLLLSLAVFAVQALSPALAQEPAAATAERAPMRVLFLGNSYTEQNKLPWVVQALAASARIPVEIEVEARTPGGCTFERHWIGGRSVDLIRQGGWDVVVLQEQSQLPLSDPLLMVRNGKKLIAEVREAGARPLLFMTWARSGELDTTEALESAYRGLGAQADAEVAPVGLAWREALERKPHWELHKADGSHPTPRGTYLAACVLLGWIADLDPRSLGDIGRRELVPEEMDFLHEVASRFVPASAVLPMVRGLHASQVGDDRLALKWIKFEDRVDRLRVERRNTDEEDGAFTVVAELKGSATSWSDRDLPPATSFAYRIHPVFIEKQLALKSSGVGRSLKLELRPGSRVELAVAEGTVEWTFAGERVRLVAGQLRLVAPGASDATFEAEAAAVDGAATAIARLLPAARRIDAIPPLVVTTEAD